MISTKVKIIIAAIIILISAVSVICIYVYINHLNNKIADLSVVVAEQKNEIVALNCQIDSLEKNVESVKNTLDITNDYISNIEKLHNDEANKKQEIYEEVMKDEESKQWYSQAIPDPIISILLRDNSDIMCEDNN
jgi:uncharacterized coiled-coil protein SlyX